MLCSWELGISHSICGCTSGRDPLLKHANLSALEMTTGLSSIIQMSRLLTSDYMVVTTDKCGAGFTKLSVVSVE